MTTRINQARQTPGLPLWQRGFHDHVVRDDGELTAIRIYIRNNPLRWSLDRDNPDNTQRLPSPRTAAAYVADAFAMLDDTSLNSPNSHP